MFFFAGTSYETSHVCDKRRCRFHRGSITQGAKKSCRQEVVGRIILLKLIFLMTILTIYNPVNIGLDYFIFNKQLVSIDYAIM